MAGRMRHALAALQALALPWVAGAFNENIFTREMPDRRASRPIFVIFFVCVALMLIMWVYAELFKSKYKQAESRMTRMLSADKCLVKILKNFSIQSVNEYHFRGIKEKVESVSVGFSDISATIQGGPSIFNGFKRTPDKKVLSGVSGEFYAGRMSAIMGPSGCGKTTFLNVLCGKTKAQGHNWEVSGTVLVNGVETNIEELKPVTGFVPQDDVVHEGMTVRENFRFSAELRNPVGTTKKRLNRITEDVLQVLQLEAQQNIQVGNRISGGGLSGGQRKRVNIGLEMAACPTLLFLDEPTSGLDATSSLLLCEMLKKMTGLGVTVVMVIHQPRYGLFTLLDDVLLLGKGGRTVYVGPTNEAKGYLEQLGFTMPKNENPADWMMDILSGIVDIENPSMPADTLPEALFHAWEQRPSEVGHASPMRRAGSLMRGRMMNDGDEQEVIRRHIKDEWNKICPDAHSMDAGQFQELLEACVGAKIGDTRIRDEIMQRATGGHEPGHEPEELTQLDFVRYLLFFRKVNRRGVAGETPDYIGASDDSEASSDESESDSSVDGFAEDCTHRGGDLRRVQPGFCTQLRVVMHRNLLQWWRRMTIRMLFLVIIEFAGLFLGFFDAYVFNTPPWSPTTFLNSHISIALLISVYSLNCFSGDQPVFWREASHGLNRFAFMCGRMLVDTIDWVIMCFFFTSTYYLTVRPVLHFEVYMIPFFLVGYVASGWGYLISCILPPILAPFCVAVLSFMMGGILGLPQRMKELLDGGLLEWVSSTLCFTRWSVPMDFLAYSYRVPLNLTVYSAQVQAEYDLYIENYAASHLNLPVQASPWWTGLLALLLMGTALRLASYPALRLVNARKQV